MLRLSQLNWPRILFNSRAVVLLGFAAVLSVIAIAIIHSDVDPEALSPLVGVAVSVAAGAGALGYFALLICMGFFWLRCDSSSTRTKALWFVLLLIGWGFGSQIVYYAVVYVPAVFKKLRNPGYEGPPLESLRAERTRKLFGPFGWALVMGWGLLFLTVAACFTFPKGMGHILRGVADYFVLWPASLLIGTWVYAMILFFRAGMKVSARSLPPDSSTRQ